LLLQAEKERLEKYLSWPGFEAKLLAVFSEEMLIGNQQTLLDHSEGGIQSLFDYNNLETLKLLYELYSPVKDGLRPICDRFKNQLI